MKKVIITIFILFTVIFGVSHCVKANNVSTEILPTMETKSNAINQIWVGTFQIVWNEVMDNIVKAPIEFISYKSIDANNLNKQEFKKINISEKSYYTKYGTVSFSLKREIEKAIKKKFNEKSDILDSFNWQKKTNNIFVYAMLKKDFKFIKAFDKLSKAPFGDNPTSVEYFGINSQSNKNLYDNVDVLFYNSNDDFAVKLNTKDNDKVILYRTNDNKTFKEYNKDIQAKSDKYKGSNIFSSEDTLTIPNIDFYLQTSFVDVENHPIKNSKFVINKTLETVDFTMNNEGVKLKSEAAIMMKLSALPPNKTRHFDFTDSFVLFLIEDNQNVPYFAIKVTDVEILNQNKK